MTLPVPTVFVVDDDASVRRALTRLFSSVGLRVETFAGAADFIARGAGNEHGCLLLDIKMPTTSGLELQQQLETAGVAMPVIFLSAHADVPVTVRAMKKGALEVFTKPFQADALLAAVHRAIAVDAVRRRERTEYEMLRQRYERLTPREQTVMTKVVTGLLNKQVAGLMGTSEKTVKVHRARVMAKMEASSLPELVRMADRLGLSPGSPNTPEGVPKVQ
ncbi:MAG TPA: response regulator [Vicinamibacterales bacterium]|jgi:FixJ family two-component response regulator|nr:response regulator [Vicinamibacterales bacterium]